MWEFALECLDFSNRLSHTSLVQSVWEHIITEGIVDDLCHILILILLSLWLVWNVEVKNGGYCEEKEEFNIEPHDWTVSLKQRFIKLSSRYLKANRNWMFPHGMI